VPLKAGLTRVLFERFSAPERVDTSGIPKAERICVFSSAVGGVPVGAFPKSIGIVVFVYDVSMSPSPLYQMATPL
jgi:hypothetical protein